MQQGAISHHQGTVGTEWPGGKVGTICFDAEWFGVIRKNKDWSGGDLSFEDIKGRLFFGAPFPLCISFSQVKQEAGMMGEILYEPTIEVGESQE